MGTRTHVRFFSLDQVEQMLAEVGKLEHDLATRAPFISPENYVDAWERIESVRLAAKRLGDIVPD